MADLTNRLFLSIYARDLTGSGFAGVAAGLHGLGGAAGMAATALGVGLVGGIGASIRAAIEYQKMITVAGNNTTLTTAGVQQMSDTVKKLGAETGAPLDQLAEGFRKVVNYGYSAADAAKILAVANKAALSTGANTGDASGTLANVLHEYGKGARDAATYMNVLHLAAAQGNSTLQEFTTGGARAINMAANLNVPFTQVAATLSALSRHESLRDANTQVVGFFSKLVNPAKQAQQALAGLTLKTGIDVLGDFTPAGLKAKGLTGVLADLKAATGGNVAEMFKLVPALRGGMAVMLLTGTATGDYKAILDSLNQTMSGKSNPVAAAYAAYQKTLASQLAIVKTNVQLLAIAFGTKLLPYVTQAVTWVGQRLPQAASALTARLTPLVTSAVAVGRAFLAAVGAMARVASSVKSLIAPLLGVTTHLGTTRQGTAQVGAALALLIPAVVAIKVGMVAWRVATAAWVVTEKAAAIAQGAFTLAQKAGTLAMAGARAVVVAYTAANKALALAYVAVRLGIIQSTFATVANKIATAASTFATVANRIAVEAVTLATKAWTLALEGAKIATMALTLYGGQAVIGMVAQKIAAGAVMLATKAWSAAQWLLNTALTDNPIGIVVFAIAGLTAGVIWAYKNVGWFHDAVNNAWKFLSSVFAPGLGTVASGLKNVLGSALDWVTNKVKGLIDFFGNLLHMVSSIPGVKDAIGAAYKVAGVSPTGTRTGAHGAANHPASQTGGVNLLAARLRGREGYGTGSSGVPAPTQHVLGYHAAAAAHHGLNAAQRAAQAYLAGKPKARSPLQSAQLGVQTDTALWKQGRRADAQITHDIAVLAKLDPKKAALLQAQFDAQVHRRNDAIRHHAAAQQVRVAHHNVAIAHHGAVVAHHAQLLAVHKAAAAQRAKHHTATLTLRAQYQNDNTQFATDMRDHKYGDARLMIGALTTLKRTMEMNAGVSAGQATKDAATYSDSLLSKLDAKTGIVAGLKKLTAPKIGTGFHRSVYGYTSRQQVGQGVGLGETLVTFGGRVGKDPAQQMIEKLEIQVQQLTRQNQALTALLGAVEDGTAATISVRDAIKGAARAMPGAGIGNPLRVAGLATAVR